MHIPDYARLEPDSRLLKLDYFCSDAEDFLGKYAAIPLLGAVPALLKLACGVVQCVCALVVATTALFFVTNAHGREMLLYSLRQVVHGLANMLAGILQAIPVLGLIIARFQANHTLRFLDKSTAEDKSLQVDVSNLDDQFASASPIGGYYNEKGDANDQSNLEIIVNTQMHKLVSYASIIWHKRLKIAKNGKIILDYNSMKHTLQPDAFECDAGCVI